MLDSIIQPVISMQTVSKTYGRETVLSDINFNIQSGECVVLVGHNGAGKTTLMKLMLGLTRPSAGRVEVLGGDPVFASAVAQHRTWGYLPESVAFNEAMTGSEVLTFYAQLKGLSIADCRQLLVTSPKSTCVRPVSAPEPAAVRRSLIRYMKLYAELPLSSGSARFPEPMTMPSNRPFPSWL